MEIKFKGKVNQVFNLDNTLAYEYIKVPTLTRSHVNMAQARKHPKYHGLANSDLFPNILKRISKEKFNQGIIKLNNIPDGVKVDTSKFLAVVSFVA